MNYILVHAYMSIISHFWFWSIPRFPGLHGFMYLLICYCIALMSLLSFGWRWIRGSMNLSIAFISAMTLKFLPWIVTYCALCNLPYRSLTTSRHSLKHQKQVSFPAEYWVCAGWKNMNSQFLPLTLTKPNICMQTTCLHLTNYRHHLPRSEVSSLVSDYNLVIISQ